MRSHANSGCPPQRPLDMSDLPNRPVRRPITLFIFCSYCKGSLVNQASGRAPIPSSVSALAAVLLVVFTLVLHKVGFAWSTGMILATGLCLFFLASFLVVRVVHERRSPGDKDRRSV